MCCAAPAVPNCLWAWKTHQRAHMDVPRQQPGTSELSVPTVSAFPPHGLGCAQTTREFESSTAPAYQLRRQHELGQNGKSAAPPLSQANTTRHPTHRHCVPARSWLLDAPLLGRALPLMPRLLDIAVAVRLRVRGSGDTAGLEAAAGARHLRPWLRSPEATTEYASFTWPLTTVAEVRRLLASRHLCPTWLLLGDFSGVWAESVETTRGVITLAVDRRPPTTQCLAYCGDFHDIVPLCCWDWICAWPSCTHQSSSNGPLLAVKALDGRMFWGLVGVLYALFAGRAHSRMVEQPVISLGRFFKWPSTRIRTTSFGDWMGKTICLYLVAASVPALSDHHRALDGPPAKRRTHWSFADSEERDRHRSSWEHFPLFVAALTSCLRPSPTAIGQPSPVPTFAEAVEELAVAWHFAGWPLPEGYDAADGLPPTAAAREYQLVRGPGDGRRPPGVVPFSMRTALVISEPTEPPPSAAVEPLAVESLSSAQLISLAALTMQGFMLFFMTSALQPLVFAHLSGMHVLGAELPLSLSPKSLAMRVMERWAGIAWGAAAPATTFMIGRYLDGPRVGVAVLPFIPPTIDVVRTPQDRRRLLARGVTMGWLTFAALAGCAIADPVARAFASIDAFRRPVHGLADQLFAGEDSTPVFAFGQMRAASMVPVPRLLLARTPTELLLARDAADAMLLRSAILERTTAGSIALDGWADRIRPPEVDLHDELAALLPDFSDPYLLSQPFTRPYEVPLTKPLPRSPPQPTRVTPFCVRSPIELLREVSRRRLHAWLEKCLDQLICIEQGKANCEQLRGHPLVIGQQGLKRWARGVVWDFTFERDPCAVPLDFTLPIDSDLDLDYLRRRLVGYRDQRLLSYLLEGVRFEADVELQAVFVPHLISLPKGFASVRKELYRQENLGWYKFFDHVPFWPIYFNGQGAAARKLEVRYRRTTECGGPRKPTCDETGLQALSINEASAINHFPRHFHDRLDDPVWRDWLRAKDLLDPSLRELASRWPHEDKPTLTQVMVDLSVLLGAARLLEEPIYIFGDDAKDYFSQLAISSEDWWKLGVVFLRPPAEGELSRHDVGRLFFVSERRLGFGAKPSSNIAQRFSEALLYMLRQDMDAAEAAVPLDTRPSAREWRRRREQICARLGTTAADRTRCTCVQTRLWFAHMYTDDPIFAVVGVERALRLLACWHTLTTEVKLLMAIPEKRNLGTWAPWLGVIICAGLGLVIVPKAKLLRTGERLVAALTKRLEFGEYRSLLGMLEHLRCVNCAPASVMYGLYGPHRSTRIRADGPTALVRVTAFIALQLQRWLELLTHTGGAPVTAALRKVRPTQLSLTYVVSSDAATDSEPPGIGGFCHGLYWYLAILPEWLTWLHITVLEMLATGGSAMAFAHYLAGAAQVTLQSDSLATPHVLSRHKARSDMLSLCHHELLHDASFAAVAEHAACAHLGGDCNVFSDAISRGLWKRFFALCRALSIRPVQVAAPPALVAIIKRLVALAKMRGVPVRQSTYSRADPIIPPAMLGLGRRSSAHEEADAVAISSRLLDRMNGRATTATPPTPAPAIPLAGAQISKRLASRLTAALAAQPPAAASKATSSERRPSSVKRPSMTASGPAMPTALQATWVGGVRVTAIPTGPLPATALRDAAHRCAAQRAASFAQAGLASNRGVAELTRLLQHAVDLNDYGSSHGTRQKDGTAYHHWEAFAELIGFDPVLTAEQVRDFPSHVSTLLATFLLYVYPKMKGKKGRQWAKPRSAFAYVLAIIRIFRGWKIILPPAKAVKGELHGLLRAFVNVYGVAALMPARREPFRFSMIRAMQHIAEARLGTRSYRADSHIGRAFRGILAVGWRTGHRLAEFVAHPSGEVCYLTRGSISYIISGVVVDDPTAAQLSQIQPGDVILITPPRSKTDQFGEIHCPFPSSVPYSTDPCSAGNILVQLEKDRACRGAARAGTPLFADEWGLPYTHSVMDTLLHHMLVHCFGTKVATCHSWHSMRIGLATALKAANVDDAVIQLICRWMNPESLRAYARHGQSLHISSVDKAEKAIIDTVQSANVPKTCNSEGAAALNATFGGTISARARAVLDAADDDEATTGVPDANTADTSPLPATGQCQGRRVLVPRAVWPAYACVENNGTGWSATIIRFNKGAATVRFTHHVSPRGLPYPDVELQLRVLKPI